MCIMFNNHFAMAYSILILMVEHLNLLRNIASNNEEYSLKLYTKPLKS